MLEIKNLHATVDGNEILRGLNLSLPAGEVHAIMGPNGSGKSTLSYVLAGRDGYEVTEGEVLLHGESILELEPEERAAAGIFLAFQYPIEIPGVPNTTFLKEAVNALRKARGEEQLDAMQFLKILRAKVKELGIPEDFLKRAVNAGFRWREEATRSCRWRASSLLRSTDETDSGLDIDALKAVADGVTPCALPIGPCWSSRTINACSTTSCLTGFMCFLGPHCAQWWA